MKSEILSKIKFSYKLAENPKTFLPESYRNYYNIYDCTIEYNGKSYNYEYELNKLYNKPNFEEVMESLFSDMFYYLDCKKDYHKFVLGLSNNHLDRDFDVLDNFYYQCKKATEALHEMFTDDEIRMIYEDIFYRT